MGSHSTPDHGGMDFLPSQHQGVQFRSGKNPVLVFGQSTRGNQATEGGATVRISSENATRISMRI